MNIVGQIGFGRGNVELLGAMVDPTYPFVLPPLGDSDEILVFSGHRIRQDLTFNWFLHNVVCKEKPSFCEARTATTTSSPRRSNKRELLHDT